MWPFKDHETETRKIRKEVLSTIRESDIASRQGQNDENDAAWKMNICGNTFLGEHNPRFCVECTEKTR